jgi:hypothetical protein
VVSRRTDESTREIAAIALVREVVHSRHRRTGAGELSQKKHLLTAEFGIVRSGRAGRRATGTVVWRTSGSRRLAKVSLQGTPVDDVDQTISIKVCSGMGVEKSIGQEVQISLIYGAIVVKVWVASVTDAIEVGITLPSVRNVQAIIEIVTNTVAIAIDRAKSEQRPRDDNLSRQQEGSAHSANGHAIAWWRLRLAETIISRLPDFGLCAYYYDYITILFIQVF